MNTNDQQYLSRLGEKLKQMRIQKGFTQEKLAYTIGVEISQISRIERGVINTSILNMYKIATALNLSVKDIVDF